MLAQSLKFYNYFDEWGMKKMVYNIYRKLLKYQANPKCRMCDMNKGFLIQMAMSLKFL